MSTCSSIAISSHQHYTLPNFTGDHQLEIDVVLLDRSPQSPYAPLLYKVPSDAVYTEKGHVSVRQILDSQKKSFVSLGEVAAINKHDKRIHLMGGEIVIYSHLIEVAGLDQTLYHHQWDEFCTSIETLHDAIKMQRPLSRCFQQEERRTKGCQLKNHRIHRSPLHRNRDSTATQEYIRKVLHEVTKKSNQAFIPPNSKAFLVEI